MSDNPQTTPPGGGDARVQSLVRLAGLILNQVSVYGFDHPVTRTVVEHCFKELSSVLDGADTLVIEVSESGLVCNGEDVPGGSMLVQTFTQQLLERDIRQFSLVRGLTAGEFDRLLHVLVMPVAELHAAGGFAAALETAKLTEKAVRLPPPLPGDAAPRRATHQSAPVSGTGDYYTTKKRKFLDFALGFWGLPSLLLVSIIVVGLMLQAFVGDEVIGFVLAILALVVAIAVPIHFFRKRRRLIAIGFIAAVVLVYIVIPLVVVGACFILLTGSGFL